jgi:Fic family protein
MMTLRVFSESMPAIPTAAAWYLADLGEARGKRQPFVRQAPQRLKALREHALIESAISSNRIEGVEVDRARIGTVVFGQPPFRDRNEEEVHGYREALSRIHSEGAGMPISEETILALHRLARGGIGDAGQYKQKDSDIIETYPDGRVRIRFKTVPAVDTPGRTRQLLALWASGLREQQVPPLIVLAAFNLDFLCIHPFRDGNGRVSRLLLLLQLYHLGFEVGRYIGLERLIEEHKDRYYETLEKSSHRWHEGRHDPWLYIGYLLYILKLAYQECEERLGQIPAPRGEKTALILRAIDHTVGAFQIAGLQHQCPGVSIDMIRRVLKNLRAEGRVECLGRGQDAQWRKTELGNNTPNG